MLWKKILFNSFQNYYINQTKHTPQGVFYGGSRLTNKGGSGELLDKFKQKFYPYCTFSQFHVHDYLKELIVMKPFIRKQCLVELYPWIMPPCIPYLAKNVSPPFLLLVIPTMYGLPYPFSLPYHLGKILRIVGENSPAANKKNSNFPHQRYLLTKYQSPIQASFIAVAIVVSFSLCTDKSC